MEKDKNERQFERLPTKHCKVYHSSSFWGHLVENELAASILELDVGAIQDELVVGTVDLVLFARVLGEAPLVAHNNLLATGKLVLGTTKSLNTVSLVDINGTYGHENLANLDTCHGTGGLAPGSAHTRLQTIGSGARQHLVDAHHVVRVDTNPHVEVFLATGGSHVTVGALACGLNGF